MFFAQSTDMMVRSAGWPFQKGICQRVEYHGLSWRRVEGNDLRQADLYANPAKTGTWSAVHRMVGRKCGMLIASRNSPPLWP
jgi:hypothetical protein